jgi:hypothetical protein
MYAVYEFRTNAEGVMQTLEPFKTPNPVYAQNKIFTLAAGAVGSEVYVHTILCVDEHGRACFNTPLYFEHIPDEEETVEG